MKRFKEQNKKKKMILICGISMMVLITILVMYRSYAIYQENQSFNVMKGLVPSQDYDIKFAFISEDKEGNQTYLENIPEGRDYDVTVLCNNGTSGVWDYGNWGPRIQNLAKSGTKCSLIFSPPSPSVMLAGEKVLLVTEGSGLYEISHSDAEITYTNDTNAQNMLKQTEYRYAGKSPDNYLIFNNELWRMIGLVNTLEGQRVKIIRNESIGDFSWSSSASSVNDGYGVNEWSQADLMTLLNHGTYYQRTSGNCLTGRNKATSVCDFSNNGFTSVAKSMIDDVTWNLGSNGMNSYNAIKAKEFYNLERSNSIGKMCSNSAWCNDSVSRTVTWQGRVGLMYPSDYGYATSGGSKTNRQTCLDTNLFDWIIDDCKENDWIYNPSISQWLLTPFSNSSGAHSNFLIHSSGRIYHSNSAFSNAVIPTLYLKSNIKITSGNGTIDTPYELSV